jgi:hypothetical protein
MKLLHPDAVRVGEDAIDDEEVVVAMTRKEFALLSSALNEALEAVEEWEFDTRLGGTPDQARALRQGSKTYCAIFVGGVSAQLVLSAASLVTHRDVHGPVPGQLDTLNLHPFQRQQQRTTVLPRPVTFRL